MRSVPNGKNLAWLAHSTSPAIIQGRHIQTEISVRRLCSLAGNSNISIYMAMRSICECSSVHHLQYRAQLKKWSPGLVNFVTVLAYHFCLALPEAFTQPGDHLLAKPCSYEYNRARRNICFQEWIVGVCYVRGLSGQDRLLEAWLSETKFGHATAQSPQT